MLSEKSYLEFAKHYKKTKRFYVRFYNDKTIPIIPDLSGLHISNAIVNENIKINPGCYSALYNISKDIAVKLFLLEEKYKIEKDLNNEYLMIFLLK